MTGRPDAPRTSPGVRGAHQDMWKLGWRGLAPQGPRWRAPDLRFCGRFTWSLTPPLDSEARGSLGRPGGRHHRCSGLSKTHGKPARAFWPPSDRPATTGFWAVWSRDPSDPQARRGLIRRLGDPPKGAACLPNHTKGQRTCVWGPATTLVWVDFVFCPRAPCSARVLGAGWRALAWSPRAQTLQAHRVGHSLGVCQVWG